jgi:hypothetical protein
MSSIVRWKNPGHASLGHSRAGLGISSKGAALGKILQVNNPDSKMRRLTWLGFLDEYPQLVRKGEATQWIPTFKRVKAVEEMDGPVERGKRDGMGGYRWRKWDDRVAHSAAAASSVVLCFTEMNVIRVE